MPEFNHRRIVLGLNSAAKQFREYVARRLIAENEGPKLQRELEKLAQDARRLERETRRG